MSRRGAERAILLGIVLAAMLGTVRAQEPEQAPLSLTGRILFGYADFDQSTNSKRGPAATIESDLSGYWRSPRILQFDFRPTVSFGSVVPGTEMGNALTGFSGEATFLQGSSFPLRVAYSRTGTSFEEAGIGAGGVLSGVKIGTTNTVLDVDWSLRFSGLPTLRLNYRDTNYGSDLPAGFAGTDSRNSRSFNGHMDYRIAGWQTAAWYQVTQSQVLFPDVLNNLAVQRDDSRNSDVGFSITRLLPLNSTVGMSADQSESKFAFGGLETQARVRNASATLTSRPVQRVNLTLQAQYTSNWEGYQEQLALQGMGIAGIGNAAPAGAANPGAPAPGLPMPIPYLALPYDVFSVSGGAAVQLGHGFTANGSAGESHSTAIERSSMRWSAGLGYQRKWRSGWMAASYSRSSTSTDSQLPTGVVTPGQGTGTYTLFTEDIGANTGSVNLIQELPRRFKLAAWAQFSDGTIIDNGISFPDHQYSGQVSVTRPVGEWTFNGSFTVNKSDLTRALIYDENSGKAISFGAAHRGLSVNASYLYGSGLALQFGNNLVWVTDPAAAPPVIGVPTLNTTSGTTITGTYRSRRNRFMVQGNWGRFHYTTLQISATQYTVASLRASYALRRLRLLAGYSKQSQTFGLVPSGQFQTRLFYFQIERRFRVF